MKAVLTLGHGGYEQLVYQDVPRPTPGSGEVLVKVLGSSVNNTDINTRLGWYSAAVTGSTEDAAAQASADVAGQRTERGGWNQATPFPLIQGTDCCGQVMAVGPATNAAMVGARVLVRPCMRNHGGAAQAWLGVDFDGAFAQYVALPIDEVFPVVCAWTDAALASMPCAYGTAENMLHKAHLAQGEHVIVTGASGGVGSAAVQLARRRGARVTAIAGTTKMAAVRALGAAAVIDRAADAVLEIGENTADVVLDVVGGNGFGQALKLLKPGGRYVTSGAIGGPIVALDLRTLYLKDLTLIGSTAWEPDVFPNLIGYIERNEIQPLVAKVFPLHEIEMAQRCFLQKQHLGKIVLIPP